MSGYNPRQNHFEPSNTVQRSQRSSTILNFGEQQDDGMRESLLKESGHLTRSEQLLDEQFEIAIRTRESLKEQRSTIQSMRSQFNDITNRFTDINGLTKKIGLRKKRDTIIVGLVFAICLALFIYSFL